MSERHAKPNIDPKHQRQEVTLSVTVTPDKKRKLENRALADDRSMSYVARQAIIKYLSEGASK